MRMFSMCICVCLDNDECFPCVFVCLLDNDVFPCVFVCV